MFFVVVVVVACVVPGLKNKTETKDLFGFTNTLSYHSKNYFSIVRQAVS